MVQLSDALTLDAPKRMKDGYLAVRAKAARTGVYKYLGSEIDPDNAHGLRDSGLVNVLRDENTVFDTAAVRSFIGKPVTDDHPREGVNSANWRDHARGTIMGAMREGEYLAFDLLLTDAAAIAKVDAGKRQLSNGYAAELEYGSFQHTDGTPCVARQAKITGGNHVALVDAGRAGPECAIKDGFALCDAITADALAALQASHQKDEPTMKIKIGDAEVDATNGEAVRIAVDNALSAKDAKIGTLTADLDTATKANQTKDGEIAALTQKLADAEVTPQKLQALADARADVIGKAKALAPNIVTDGKTDAEIRKEAVTAKLGDAAKDMADAAIEGAFIAFTKDAKTFDADAFKGGLRSVGDTAIVDEDAAYTRMVGRLTGKKTA